jgi:hypothetical protein
MFKLRYSLAALAAVLLAPAALAADLPVKASNFAFSSAYPYQSSGLFFGAYTEGAGGSVSATVPGIGAASLTTTTGALGLTAGYAWGSKGSALAYSVEGDFGFTNFNGNNAGLSLQGPMSFEQRFVIFAPWANLAAALPNFPNILGTIPPFPALQAGVTASNLQTGLAFGIKEADRSLGFAGVTSGKVWQIEPVIKLIAMEQLSNGTAVRAWAGVGLPDKGKLIGPVPGTSTVRGPEVLVGFGAYF